MVEILLSGSDPKTHRTTSLDILEFGVGKCNRRGIV